MNNLAAGEIKDKLEGPFGFSPHWTARCQHCGRQITEYWVCRRDWPAVRGCLECMSGRATTGETVSRSGIPEDQPYSKLAWKREVRR